MKFVHYAFSSVTAAGTKQGALPESLRQSAVRQIWNMPWLMTASSKSTATVRGERGTLNQAIGKSKGGMTTKKYWLWWMLWEIWWDSACYPGNASIFAGLNLWLETGNLGPAADKAFDADWLVKDLTERGSKVIIPPHSNLRHRTSMTRRCIVKTHKTITIREKNRLRHSPDKPSIYAAWQFFWWCTDHSCYGHHFFEFLLHKWRHLVENSSVNWKGSRRLHADRKDGFIFFRQYLSGGHSSPCDKVNKTWYCL